MAKQTKTAETHPITTALVDALISPVIQWCDAAQGRRAELLAAFRAHIAPETISRQTFEAWISTNPDTRTEPSFGNGMALREVATKMAIFPKK